MRKIMMIAALAGALAQSGYTTPAPSGGDNLGALLMGQARSGPALERAIAAAEQFPLGSDRNPVRAHMPQGQHAYLRRLRCASGQAPAFNRQGNVGIGAFGNIADLYVVTCPGQEPKSVYMDMYHRGYVEQRAVLGFTIVN
jgi:hypothetical protein